VAQYVEMLPSAGGATAPDTDKPNAPAPATKAVERIRTTAGDDAEALESLVTREDYGAPSTTTAQPETVTEPATSSPKPAKPRATKPKTPAPRTATPTAAAKSQTALAPAPSSSGERLAWLAVIIGAIGLVGLGAFRLRRSGRWPPAL
jgi:hypothetical protein